MTENKSYTGGCQCGAIRYRICGELFEQHLCHCRMCQKAFGAFFAPLVGVKLQDIEWIQGQPAIYRSSTIAERGFCQECGTPLTFKNNEQNELGKIYVSIGSFDKPECVKPIIQYGVESRMSWFAELTDLPGGRTDETMPRNIQDKLQTYQHPDHE